MRAGWSSVINQLLIGQALSDEFDGKILNPHGVEIDLPFWVFKRLKKLRLLERDRATGMRRIQERVFGLMALWDGPDFRPDRRYRAFDPGYQRACSKDSGYSSAFLKALGKDCSGLVNPAHRRCEIHRVQERKENDQRRGLAARRGYDARWRAARKRYLTLHPLCIECERVGRLTRAAVVDHIVPHRGDSKLFWDESNWQALCRRCHNRKTTTTDGRWV